MYLVVWIASLGIFNRGIRFAVDVVYEAGF